MFACMTLPNCSSCLSPPPPDHAPVSSMSHCHQSHQQSPLGYASSLSIVCALTAIRTKGAFVNTASMCMLGSPMVIEPNSECQVDKGSMFAERFLRFFPATSTTVAHTLITLCFVSEHTAQQLLPLELHFATYRRFAYRHQHKIKTLCSNQMTLNLQFFFHAVRKQNSTAVQ